MRRHDLTNIKTMANAKTNRKTKTFRDYPQRVILECETVGQSDEKHDLTNKKTKAFKEHPERAILETCDPCDYIFLILEAPLDE